MLQTIAISGDGKGGALEGAVDLLLVLGIICPYLALAYTKLLAHRFAPAAELPTGQGIARRNSRLDSLFQTGATVAFAAAAFGGRSNSIVAEPDSSTSGNASSDNESAPKGASFDSFKSGTGFARAAGQVSAKQKKKKASAKKIVRSGSVEEETNGFGDVDVDGDGFGGGGYLEVAPDPFDIGDKVEVAGKVRACVVWCF